MLNFRKSLLTAAAGIGLAAGMASNAHAGFVPFDLNLSVGGNGAGDALDVQVLNSGSGSSTILQSFNNGVPGTFTETGTTVFGGFSIPGFANKPISFVDGINGSTENTVTSTGHVGLGTNGAQLVLNYTASGHVSGSNLVFDGTNSVPTDLASLVLQQNGHPDITLATFAFVPGTGGTGIQSLGGLPTGVVTLQLVQVAGIPGLITKTDHVTPLGGLGLSVEFANVTPTLDPSVVPNPSPFPIPAHFTGTETIVTTDTGSVEVATVPEPTTLAMMGGGLLMLGFARRRRS